MTSSRSGTPTRRAAVCLAVLGLAAATCSPALAESAVPDVPVPAVPDLAVVVTALEEAGLEDVGLPELEPLTAIEPLTTLPAVPAQEAAAKPATAGAVAAPPPEPDSGPSAAPAVEAPLPDAPAPDAPPPAVEQTGPANVNVSVRVDSAGDNGSVEQANTAAATAPVAVSQYRPEPEPPQYQPSIPTSTTSAAEAAPAGTGEPDSSWDWNWTWNCADPLPEAPVVPAGAAQNWTWNWNWDCDGEELPPQNVDGETATQYQPAVAQYRPVNINVSIRINSPGNDGPVRQTNTAVAVLPIVIPAVRVEVAATQSSATPAAATGLSIFSPLIMQADDGVGRVIGAFTEQAREPDDCCLRPLHGAPLAPLAAPSAGVDPLRPTPDPTAAPQRRDISAPARFRAAVEVTLRLTKASAAAREARTARKPARTVRPAPRRPTDPAREPSLALGAAGFVPLTAPDGRLSTLGLLIVGIGFVFAFADHTRSVAAEVRAHGEDPDPPPDRPG